MIGSNAAAGTIHYIAITYNTLKAVYTSAEPQTIVFNFNFDSNWKSNVGTIADWNGLIAVNVGAGKERELILSFEDNEFKLGCWVSAISFIVFVVLFFSYRKWVRNRPHG